jgi:hypothetical protein
MTYRVYYQNGWLPLKTLRGVSYAAVPNVVARIYKHWFNKPCIEGCRGIYQLDGKYGIYVKEERA